jgi:cytochrome c-type biogenesis protein CcmH/NrfG
MPTETNETRIERCRRIAEEHPGSPKAWFNLGLAYTERGRIDSAAEAYREALRLDPDLVEAWVNLGGALMLKWDFQGCIAANREALSRREDTVLAHYNIGQACVYLGDGEGVVSANRRVLELDAAHAAAQYFLGVGLLATGEVQQARDAVARAKALGHSPAPEFLRALENVEKQQQSEPQPLIQHIGADAPKNPNRR